MIRELSLSEALAKETNKHHRNGPLILKKSRETQNETIEPIDIKIKQKRPSSKTRSEYGTIPSRGGLDSISEEPGILHVGGKAEKRRRSNYKFTEKRITMSQLFSPKSSLANPPHKG